MHAHAYAHLCGAARGEVSFLGVRHSHVRIQLPQQCALLAGLVTHTACLLFRIPSSARAYVVSPMYTPHGRTSNPGSQRGRRGIAHRARSVTDIPWLQESGRHLWGVTLYAETFYCYNSYRMHVDVLRTWKLIGCGAREQTAQPLDCYVLTQARLQAGATTSKL